MPVQLQSSGISLAGANVLSGRIYVGRMLTLPKLGDTIYHDRMKNQKPTGIDDLNSDAAQFNLEAWEKVAAQGNELFHAASPEQIEAARGGQPGIKITPIKKVPREWLMPLAGRDVLCLAGGGGLQGPILAAAGAHVTVTDISQGQLNRDLAVAKREGLDLTTVVADMCDLKPLGDENFDLIVNPTAVCYIEDVMAVWRTAWRVLRPGGELVVGSMKPVNFLFDAITRDEGELDVAHKIPYNDLELSEDEQDLILAPDRPVEFSHTLTSLIGGQIECGFNITGFYEDRWGGEDCLSDLIDVFFATRAVKNSM